MESTPFALDLGLEFLKGILRLETAGLLVEWRRFNILDVQVGSLDSILIPYEEIESAQFKKRIIGSTLEIRVKQPATLGAIPLPANEITLLKVTIPRAHRSAAELLVAETELRAIDSDKPDTAGPE